MTTRPHLAAPLRAAAATAALLGVAVSSLAVAGARDHPVYARVFAHYENLADPAAAAIDIRRQNSFLKRQGMPAELGLLRGEHQAAWFRDNSPDVLASIRDPLFELAYHPHPFVPFTAVVENMADLRWDEAVAEFTRFESCHVDFSTSAIDCSRAGGAAAVREIVGKPLMSVCDGGPHAVATYVYREVFGIPTQLDSGRPQLDDLLGADTQAYWYMGQLVYKNPAWSQLTMWDERSAATVVREAPGDRPTLISLLVTDKARAPDANDYANANFIPGISTAASLKVPASSQIPDVKYNARMTRWENHVRALGRETHKTGGAALVPSTMLERVHPPVEHLTRAQLAEAASALRDAVASTGALPTTVPAAGHQISHADLYELLARSLAAWRDGGALPGSVVTQGILGPIGDPVHARQLELGERRPIDGARLVGAIPPLDDRVPYSLAATEADEAVLYAAEALVLMSEAFLAVHAGDPLASLARTPIAVSLVPAGAPAPKTGARGRPGAGGGPPANADRGQRAPAAGRGGRGGRGGGATSRWDWYTQLQFWTAKPIRWLE